MTRYADPPREQGASHSLNIVDGGARIFIFHGDMRFAAVRGEVFVILYEEDRQEGVFQGLWLMVSVIGSLSCVCFAGGTNIFMFAGGL